MPTKSGRKPKFNVYSNGTVKVCAKLCSTCIYRPGSPLANVPIKQQAVDKDTTVVCHSTLDLPQQAACRGFFEATPTQPLQVAQRLGLIEFVSVK